MSTKDDGGPAFPQQAVRDRDGLLQSAAVYGVPSGLTVRDHFAAKVLQAALVNATLPGVPEREPEAMQLVSQLCACCYVIADEMLKERVKP
jgi:hypothetical protein